MSQFASPRVNLFLALAAVLLGLGVVIDLGFTQPRIREIEQLQGRRSELLGQFAQQVATEREGADLAEILAIEDLSGAALTGSTVDPLTYVGGLIEVAGLRRLALTHEERRKTVRLTRTRLMLRVEGSYRQILSFVRALEQGARLIIVDTFSIEPAADSQRMEARMSISVFDPHAE